MGGLGAAIAFLTLGGGGGAVAGAALATGAGIDWGLAGGRDWTEGAVGFAGDAAIPGTARCRREVGIPGPGINKRRPEYPGKERLGDAKPRDGP